MWQRFSESARTIIFHAQEEASALNTVYVTTEHILLGILREPDCTASKLLTSMGVGLESIQKKVLSHLRHTDVDQEQSMTLTPRSKQLIDTAYDESRKMNSNIITSVHLLLAILRQDDGAASDVLKQAGLDLEKLREIVVGLKYSETASPIPNKFFETPLMRTESLHILEDIIEEYGVSVYKDHEHCRNLLWERRGDYSREIVALQLILQVGIVDDLVSSLNINSDPSLLDSLTNRAIELLPVDRICAAWAIVTWIKALGIFDESGS